ncbi:butyrate kinase [Pelosinus sp. sgz500959]|uniref:butyrate kinase n=1 Tax=Pelosinus sp. sgz500959 TaxID=3242472 RepID=UPI00366B6B71
MKTLLVINPGATSTKIAVFVGEKLTLDETVQHLGQDLGCFERVVDQGQYRLDLILKVIANADLSLKALDGIVARGGLLKPLIGGTYAVNEEMLEDLKQGKRGEHASNLGALMADILAKQLNIPAYIVDPVSVDELEPMARISGLPKLPRVSMVHALNSKAVARKVAKKLGKEYEELNLVVAHLGTGISVTPHHKGRMIDVNNALEEGPFSPDRCGGLPARSLVKLCFSGKYTEKEMLNQISGSGGMFAYLGTKDLREAEKRSSAGDEQAQLVLDAMAYQISKEIGAMAAALSGKVDRVILTGGMAYSAQLVQKISAKIGFIAPIEILPGEEEMEALAAGALRVLRGEEQVLIY